jgi:hypothetical protein
MSAHTASKKNNELHPVTDEEAAVLAYEDLRNGKSPSTAARHFVQEEFDKVRAGYHSVKSPQQAVAIGLSKARQYGVPLPPYRGKGGTDSDQPRHRSKSRTAEAGKRKRQESNEEEEDEEEEEASPAPKRNRTRRPSVTAPESEKEGEGALSTPGPRRHTRASSHSKAEEAAPKASPPRGRNAKKTKATGTRSKPASPAKATAAKATAAKATAAKATAAKGKATKGKKGAQASPAKSSPAGKPDIISRKEAIADMMHEMGTAPLSKRQKLPPLEASCHIPTIPDDEEAPMEGIRPHMPLLTHEAVHGGMGEAANLHTDAPKVSQLAGRVAGAKRRAAKEGRDPEAAANEARMEVVKLEKESVLEHLVDNSSTQKAV